jgi:hypothetical protein
LKHLQYRSELATFMNNKDTDSIRACTFKVACIRTVDLYYSDCLKTKLHYFDDNDDRHQPLLDPLHSYPSQPCF